MTAKGSGVQMPSFSVGRWAETITVDVQPEELKVHGEKFWTRLWSSDRSKREDNLLDRYSVGAHWQKDCKTLSPHIQFANADTDEKLIAFVREHGPVTGVVGPRAPLHSDYSAAISTIENDRTSNFFGDTAPPYSATVVQRMDYLRSAREEFAALADMIAVLLSSPALHFHEHDRASGTFQKLREASKKLRLGDQDSQIIAVANDCAIEGLRRLHGLPDQPERTVTIGRETFGPFVDGKKYDKLLEYALGVYSGVVTALLDNRGRPRLDYLSDGFTEAAFADLPPVGTSGVLPALYWMLRLDALRGQIIRFCAHPACGLRFQATNPTTDVCCSAACRRKFSKMKYWNKGKAAKVRRKKRAQSRAVKA